MGNSPPSYPTSTSPLVISSQRKVGLRFLFQRFCGKKGGTFIRTFHQGFHFSVHEDFGSTWGTRVHHPPEGHRSLQHDRSNFKKHQKLFPVWLPSGMTSWCSCMLYNCINCGKWYAANDGRLLAMLPAHVRSAYPVEPKICKWCNSFSHENNR